MAGGGGGDAVSFSAGQPAGGELRRATGACAVLCGGILAWRGDALHLDDFADLLPVYVFHFSSVGFVSALLDQHGGGGDLDAGGYVADHAVGGFAVSCID